MEIRTKDGHFSESFKLFIVEEVESGRITKAEAQRKYDILGHSTVLKWCRKYGKLSYPQFENARKVLSKNKS